MSTHIKSISINNEKTIDNRSVVSNAFSSIDVNQVTGDFIVSDYSNNSIDIYPQSINSYINNILGGNVKSISSLGSFGTLNYPLDAKFDMGRGKIWICDTGNDRVIRLNGNSLVTDFTIEDIIYPYSISINPNDGSVFVKGFKDSTTGTISNYSYSGTQNNYIEFSDTKPAMSSSSLMVFDYKKNRLWWTIESSPYFSTVLMWDFENNQIVQLDILSETGKPISPQTIDIDMESGNLILTGNTRTESYLFQIFRDNCSVISISYLPYLLTKSPIYSTLVSQNNIDIIPFWFVVEDGFEDSSQITFTIESANSMSINYSVMFGNSNSNSYSTNIQIPETDNSQYRHDTFATVDVVIDDDSGVKDLSVRTQSEIYEYEDPKNYYNIPKFSWTNTPFDEEESSETSADFNIPILIGKDDKTISVLKYSNQNVQSLLSTNVSSETHKILVSGKYGEIYASEYDSLAKITANKYRSNGYALNKTAEINNTNDDIMSYSNDSVIVSTQAYTGKVIIRDVSDLSEITEYTGFDAPFKVIRSNYHSCYFVAGTNKIWKLTDSGTKKAIYEIKDFRISDIDCSENGKLCIVLSGISYDIIRVLDNNLYTFIVNHQSNGDAFRYCKYCGKGLFYILGELNDVNNYQTVNYVVNTNDKSVYVYESGTSISTTTTTTTLPPPTKNFNILFPIGGESLQIGSSQVILWQSLASISDEVTIELYKGKNLFDTIASNIKNTGSYIWQISNAYPESHDYKIKGTWLSSNNSYSQNYDYSSAFSILTDVLETTTTTTTKILDKSIGIDFSVYNNVIVSVTSGGLVNIFDLSNLANVGIFDANVSGNILSMAIQDSQSNMVNYNTRARVFVGSAPYLNDKWDSGVVNTDLNYMYYGGGNNLFPATTYYMNIQTYTDKYGWSEVQTKDFTMPI